MAVVPDRSEYDCAICLSLLYQPVVGPCGHDFCQCCYARCLGSGSQPARCPLCRERLGSRVPGICRRLETAISQLFPAELAERELEVRAQQAAEGDTDKAASSWPSDDEDRAGSAFDVPGSFDLWPPSLSSLLHLRQLMPPSQRLRSPHPEDTASPVLASLLAGTSAGSPLHRLLSPLHAPSGEQPPHGVPASPGAPGGSTPLQAAAGSSSGHLQPPSRFQQAAAAAGGRRPAHQTVARAARQAAAGAPAASEHAPRADEWLRGARRAVRRSARRPAQQHSASATDTSAASLPMFPASTATAGTAHDVSVRQAHIQQVRSEYDPWMQAPPLDSCVFTMGYTPPSDGRHAARDRQRRQRRLRLNPLQPPQPQRQCQQQQGGQQQREQWQQQQQNDQMQ